MKTLSVIIPCYNEAASLREISRPWRPLRRTALRWKS